MKKRLITSALPYVNNIPHLGNLIQVLSADVFARYCRLAGYETLYVCGTDEYGTATETRALEEGITPRELCDRYYAIHTDIYNWFNIAFDKWGRTSTPEHTGITQAIFKKLDEAGYIKAKTIEQLYCGNCSRFLADRYVRGVCPHCGYEGARGDQCENCGKLLDPMELQAPQCITCGNPPIARETSHLYIDLPAILPKLNAWMETASQEGRWANNAVRMTQAWIRDGLRERGITRDLKWGIPVPKEGYENKVFYVWFDAPIGYVSITATHTSEWEKWWRNPEEVELFQFIGKDNIPFHTVIFPSSQLGTGEKWTMLHHMSSTEYLNYEDGKFSKSQGVGVFGNDARDTGVPADIWRFYIFYNRPEKSDAIFTWADFQEKVNGELIGNLGNLVNRTLTFIDRYFDGRVPDGEEDARLWSEVRRIEKEITGSLEWANLRDGFRSIFQLASLGNKAFQDGEPWRTRTEHPEQAASLLRNLAFLIRDLAILIAPYLPATSTRIAGQLGTSATGWESLGKLEGLSAIGRPEILFTRLEDDFISQLKTRFSGTQADRAEKPEAKFSGSVELRAAKIISVERHPKADKLYIETIDLGSETRQIVSGLVGHYDEDGLLGKTIVLVSNLKPAKLRGVESQGMLLAAKKGDTVEVLFVKDAQPGEPVHLEGFSPSGEPPRIITIDEFFEVPIFVRDFQVYVGDTPMVCGNEKVKTEKVDAGEVG
ncbi:MAG: methionine--tRNA ligase [Spirochaetales bacterium]|nr:methionine--tRNA ligase [Spirochaetales bacterium]